MIIGCEPVHIKHDIDHKIKIDINKDRKPRPRPRPRLFPNRHNPRKEYKTVSYLNLPQKLRQRNYNGGSCVHASTVSALRWQGQHKMADWWRDAYSGGEYSDRHITRMNQAGIKYAYTTSGNSNFLEWAIRNRYIAGITWGGNHMVNLVGFDNTNAYILNNNNTNKIIKQDKQRFFQQWKNEGGWAFALIYNSPPPDYYISMK